MNRKNLIAAALAAGSLMGIASVAQAVPAVVAGTGGHPGAVVQYPYGHPQHVFVQPAPPAPIFEAAPAPRAGYIWTPGHYVWNGNQYVWQSGNWLEMREGYAWQPAHWQQRADGSWALVGGTWVATDRFGSNDRRMNRGPNGDMDHDGIRNADDDDRDGDGVANWLDDFPNNRNRS